MIILHSHHDKRSREYVELYGEGNDVIGYPECVDRFPWIRAFPSVIIDVPKHKRPAKTETIDGDTIEIPEVIVDAHEELLDIQYRDEIVGKEVTWDLVEENVAFCQLVAEEFPAE